MFISRIYALPGVLALVTGCATTPLPPFPSTHPASPDAPEASVLPLGTRLSADEATRTTDDLLKETAESSAPADSTQMPPMRH
jgi:hypothetical protein